MSSSFFFSLIGNPVCSSALSNTNYCQVQLQDKQPYSTSLANCGGKSCPPDQKLSPQSCECAYPYEGIMHFRAPSFRELSNVTTFHSLEMSLWVKLGLTPGSVSLQNPFFDSNDYLLVQLSLFPSTGQYFNRSEVQRIGFELSNQTYKPPKEFGPYYFLADYYPFSGSHRGASLRKGVVIGIAIGSTFLVLSLIGLAIYAILQKKRAERAIGLSRPFASWAPSGKDSGGAPQLKGARWFSYDDLKKCTSNFSEHNEIGSGGYGKVYKGVLSDGKTVAIKRAQQGSMQGGLEFNEALNHIQVLKRELAGKDTEIQQMKAHISELNLHAEAQAKEYKQKFKALEAMAEQVKPEGLSINCSSANSYNALSNKSEKNATKSRGSSSPFKCIGLGLAQQVKYEKVEELSAARLRIEELEAQAACRQREIFALNAKLASAESMTHDVIRDLLGVKLDMTTCVSLFDNEQAQDITEKVQFLTLDPQDKEVVKLKKQLNEFIEERQGWLLEMDRKQAELVAVQIALENLRQRDQMLKTENEMLKMENTSKKNKVLELEEEIKKLSGQQNLQQRIHHHAKIKEENNKLKTQNEELSAKLRRAEVFLSRVKEDLARLRSSAGVKTSINFDEEQRLMIKLKEIEEEKVELAQQLLRLSTNVLKVAGISRPTSDINPSLAEEALQEIKNRITTLEMEQEDLKFKNKIIKEKIRLSELMPQTSPLNSRSEENRLTPPRASLAPFLSSFDR